MRRILLIIFGLFPLIAFSQNLLVDKPTQDGARYIGSYYYFCHASAMDGNPIGFSVNGVTEDGIIKQYFLGMKIATTTSFKLPKGGLLLLKCPDGSVIELKQMLKDYETDDISFFDNRGVLTYNIYGQYEISFDDLMKLTDQGISKIRVETEGSPFDKEYSKKKSRKIAKAFYSHMEEIKKAIRNPRDLHSDF